MRTSGIAILCSTTGLIGCASAPPTLQGLAGTQWQLASIQSMDDSQGTVRPADSARYVLAFGADGRVSVRLDCNRGSATWQAEPAGTAEPGRASGSLQFGPLASTRAQCAADSLAPRLAGSWPYVRGYVLEPGRLHLSLMADGGILSWVPAR
ncbi:MAG: META domain-containing protein [Burkholderiales bacterium]|nr:META domain-containing protein [Burkholderiales bacterium]